MAPLFVVAAAHGHPYVVVDPRGVVDLSSHNTNPPGVFDGEAVPLSDVADTRIAESVAEHGSLPTAETPHWTRACVSAAQAGRDSTRWMNKLG
jgi:hypothetical protein